MSELVVVPEMPDSYMCGREYLARQTKTPRTFHLTPITL